MKIECYEGSSGAWSWRLKSDNGHVLADGAKSYATRAGLDKGIAPVAEALGKHLTDTVYVPLLPEGEDRGTA